MILTYEQAEDAYALRGITDWGTLTARLPRNSFPAVLDLIAYDLPVDQMAAAVGDAWQSCEYPEHALDRDTWIEFLDWTGYVVNGVRAPKRRPRKPKTLYRGGTLHDRMAWTADKVQAEWFRDRYPDGRMWSCVAPTEAILMHFDGTEGRDGETEYVVNPNQITNTREMAGD